MWIIDTCYRDGCVEIWEKGEGQAIRRRKVPYEPGFDLHLPDPHQYWELLEALGEQYGAEECVIRTVYGELPGYHVRAGRDVADAIEHQTGYAAQLFNVDLRYDQRYLAEQGLFPCGDPGDSRFSTSFSLPLQEMEVTVEENPFGKGPVTRMQVRHDRTEQLSGSEPAVLSDLADLVASADPDVVLFPLADVWMPRLVAGARRAGLDPPFTRTGRFRRLDGKSYMSYGRTEFRVGALIPDGRVLIDTRQSFNYREGGLSGILIGSRLTGLSPNMAARYTSGTLISTYEVYEALQEGIVVPYRKSDPERVRKFGELRACDRGGMMFQPVPGLYGAVHQIDFSSLYPSVIVKYNLSPETLDHPGQEGFLPRVLRPLLAMRLETKRRKEAEPGLAGIDSLLKWMLVTCFGYTGYKNAKFGRIEVHELITGHAREILLESRDFAEQAGFSVLHGIVDCLWLQGDGSIQALKDRIERETGLHTTLETYDWLVFLPMPDGFGAYNRYYGRLDDGEVKVRGIAARRRDTPAYVREFQEGLLGLLGRARSPGEMASLQDEAVRRYREAREALVYADPRKMVVRRQISRLKYSRSSPEGSAVQACLDAGIEIEPGMEIGYVVTDARKWRVALDWNATCFDAGYYRQLLEKAWKEVYFALECAREAAGSSSAE
jgi:DNA polymerase I